MLRTLTFLFLIALSFSASAQTKVATTADLEKLINDPGQHIKVINFWATWCGPCVKEMPLFEKLNSDRKDVAVTLVSTDMILDPNPEKVHKFVARKKLKSQVMILDVSDSKFIDSVDKEWEGGLPATLVINSKTGKRAFVQKELHAGDLEKLIDEVQ